MNTNAENWEVVIDFTKIDPQGVDIEDLLLHLQEKSTQGAEAE